MIVKVHINVSHRIIDATTNSLIKQTEIQEIPEVTKIVSLPGKGNPRRKKEIPEVTKIVSLPESTGYRTKMSLTNLTK